MAAMDTSLWAIAMKGDANASQPKNTISDLADISPFEVPKTKLRVGTLDSLMSLSDDITKMETLAEATVTKMYKQLSELKKDEEPTIKGVPVVTYTTKQWQWDEAKFQVATPLKLVCENISLRISAIDDELKNKLGEVNALKSSLQVLERKSQGNLMVRGLADIVTEDNIMESDYMTTLFVVVPKLSLKDFESTYEKMADYVVPMSGKLLNEDSEFGLYKVVIFRKSLDQFRANAREKRLTIREFTYNPDAVANEANQKAKDTAQLAELTKMLTNWCSLNYAESYGILMHLKAVKIFTESVLRYGLTPTYEAGMVPNFQSFFVQPKKGKAETLRKAMAEYFGGGDIVEEEVAGPGTTGDFYPYVYASIETAPAVS